MEPPIEYPKIYDIEFLIRGTNPKNLSREVIGKMRLFILLAVIKYITVNLNDFLTDIRDRYKSFINSLKVKTGSFGEIEEDPRNNFISIGYLDDILDEIDQTSREGDIIHFYISELSINTDIELFYISDFGNKRYVNVLKIDKTNGNPVLPKEAKNVIDEYNIKTINDINNIYPDLNIVGYMNPKHEIIYFM